MHADSACESCQFWRRLSGAFDEPTGLGLCHRYPPILPPDRYANYGEWLQPHTDSSQWCGEYRAGAAGGGA